MSTKGTKYHIALDGQGYILAGTPTQPQRQMTQQPIFGNRFASGDRDYSDFSLFWFLAQTDWSGGIKDEKRWKDDAHYYASSNIDAYSEFGSFKLANAMVQESGDVDYFTAGTYGVAERVTGTVAQHWFVGDTTPRIWYKTSATGGWSALTDLTSNWRSFITQILTLNNRVWFLSANKLKNFGSSPWSDSEAVNVYYQGSATDHTAAILSALSWIGNGHVTAKAMCVIGSTLYIAIDGNMTGNRYAIVYTDDNGASWSVLFKKHFDNNSLTFSSIYDMFPVGNEIYYLLDLASGNGGVELRVYDIDASTDTLIYKFNNGRLPSYYMNNDGDGEPYAIGTGGRFLIPNPKTGNLIIVMPTSPKTTDYSGELWEYNLINGVITKIWETNEYKVNNNLSGYITDGGTIHKNKIYFGNLIYDGEYFFNDVKPHNDMANSIITGMFSDGNYLFYKGSINYAQRVKRVDLESYRSTEDANWIIFNEIEEVSTIDKLADEVTIIFDKFDEGEEIKVSYSIDNGDTYTSLGGASYDVDGDSVTSKTFKFPPNTIFQKMIIKIYLNSDGTSTPVFHDFSLKYLPLPNYNLVWNLRVKCIDNMKLLDGVSQEPKRGIDLRNVLKNAWLNNRIIKFEDVDYAETKLSEAITSSDTTVGVYSTSGFPEQGTFQIDNEIIKYTSKNDNEFLNCTRGFRGTLASSHIQNQVVSNIKNVLIYKYEEQNPIINDNDKDEFIINLQLIEMSSGS